MCILSKNSFIQGSCLCGLCLMSNEYENKKYNTHCHGTKKSLNN